MLVTWMHVFLLRLWCNSAYTCLLSYIQFEYQCWYYQNAALVFLSYKLCTKSILAYTTLVNHTILFHCSYYFAVRSNVIRKWMQYTLHLMMILWCLSCLEAVIFSTHLWSSCQFGLVHYYFTVCYSTILVLMPCHCTELTSCPTIHTLSPQRKTVHCFQITMRLKQTAHIHSAQLFPSHCAT
jgi:hypothetical protein